MTDYSPARVAALLHPQRGVLRGIIDFTEQGKGGRDRDDKLVNIKVGELREIDAVLRMLERQIAVLDNLQRSAA